MLSLQGLARLSCRHVLLAIGARHRPFDRAMRVHALLDVLYRIVEKQPNFVYSDGTCLEFSFIRRKLQSGVEMQAFEQV